MADLTEYDRVATELVELIRQHPNFDDRQIIFDFFGQHLDFLDLTLLGTLTKIFRVSPNIELTELYWRLGNRFDGYYSCNGTNTIEVVIGLYNLIIEVCDRHSSPEDWAMVQYNLGLQYNKRIKGNNKNNIESSIRYYKNALEFYTKQASPEEWSTIQDKLSSAYFSYLHSLDGDETEKIECFLQTFGGDITDTFEHLCKKNLMAWIDSQKNADLDYSDNTTENRVEEQLRFLLNTLQLVSESQGDFQLVYQNLQQNLTLLDIDLIEVLNNWVTSSFVVVERDTQKLISGVIGNFATIIQNFPLGNKAVNIDISLACNEICLRVFTATEDSEFWAMAQNNLATAYLERIIGNRAENLEKSIEGCELALKIRTRNSYPVDWAMTQSNLAYAYSLRIKEDKAENLEKSISYYESVLEVVTRNSSLIDWAMIQNNLGIAYSERIEGDRAENLEQSIKCLEATLDVFPQNDLPMQWAKTHCNLARAYVDRIKEDRAENLEKSIVCCESALQVFTQNDSPTDWAMTLHNLAAAYSKRIKEDKAENLEKSIVCYESALKVFTQANSPVDWAITQSSLATAYGQRIKEDGTENLEKSIACSKSALKVFTQVDSPIDWAGTQHNLGTTYQQCIERDRAENLEQSISCYESALMVRKPTNLPIACLQSARDLGNLHFNQGNWQEAINTYEIAMQAAETSRSWSVNDSERQRILTEALSVYENAIQCAVNLKDYKRAIEYTERVRSRQLVELIASKDLYSDVQVPAEIQAYLAEYQQLNQEVDNLRENGEDRSGITKTSRNSQDFRKNSEKINKAEARKQILYNQIRTYDPVLAGQIAIAPISHAEIQQLITNPHTAILSFYSTNHDTYIFILKHDREPELFVSKSQGKQELQQWLIDNWLNPYNATDNDQWQSQMLAVLAEISTRLQLPQLIANHLTDIHELVLVPHLLLHQIPIAALPIAESNELLGEKFTIRSIPSCQILQYCQERPSIHTNVQGIVEDADDSLMGARYEGQKIAEIYSVSDGDRLRGKTQATVANYRQLLGRVNRLHSSHHASFRPDQPLESALFLADGKITLGDLLLGERYQNLDEIFLSACETHVGKYTFTDDVTTITTGFLSIGARSVQSTLWSVDDLVTAIFDVFYHQERREGYNRAVSLQRAQVRLRYLSGEEFRINHYPELKQLLDKFLPSELDKLDQKLKQLNIAKKTATGDDLKKILQESFELDDRYNSLENLVPTIDDYCKQAYPFAAPYYWAGFICQGMA